MTTEERHGRREILIQRETEKEKHQDREKERDGGSEILTQREHIEK